MTGSDPPPSDGARIDALADWLMERALGESTVEETAEGCFQRLHGAGVPLTRAHVAFRTLHPLYGAVGLTWTPGEGLAVARFARDNDQSPEWRRSPGYHLIQTGQSSLRRRLTGPDARLDFRVLEDLRDRGATDYLVYLVVFDPELETGLWGSWTTDRTGGFSDAEVAALERIQQRLAVALKVTIKDQIAANVVATYLGPDAGKRVLQGQIARGDGETIRAAIWMSDLRRSTALAEGRATADVLAMLNSYFDCTAGAVLAQGGEVLLLIGDAVLAIFSMGKDTGGADRACRAALAAAADARARLAKLNEARLAADREALDFGIGLHLGELMFGNIGVPERLQFTVVGPAANEVAHLETLTKSLGRPVLVSAAFADRLDLPWESLGAHVLPGIEEPRKVFAPPPSMLVGEPPL